MEIENVVIIFRHNFDVERKFKYKEITFINGHIIIKFNFFAISMNPVLNMYLFSYYDTGYKIAIYSILVSITINVL